MIQANELRIGNYVSDIHASSSFMAKVNKIMTDRVYYGAFHSHPSNLKPIPLTEDILLKCGGERDEHNDVFVYLDKTHDLRLYLTNGFIQQCKGYYSPLSNYPHITHLHQLQNLYFALTQQELNIQL